MFLSHDEPTKSIQTVNSIQFTGVIWHLQKSRKVNLYKNHSVKNNSVHTISLIFQLIYHITGSNQTCLVSDSTSEDLTLCFRNDNCQLTNYSSASDHTEWYNEININYISFIGYYVPISIDDEVSNELEVFYLLDEMIVKYINFKLLIRHEDLSNFQLYLVLCAQLMDVRWYNQWFQTKAQLREPTSNDIFIPQVEGFLQVPTVQEGQYTDVLCYYSLKFTSILLSDNDVLCSSKFGRDYNTNIQWDFHIKIYCNVSQFL